MQRLRKPHMWRLLLLIKSPRFLSLLQDIHPLLSRLQSLSTLALDLVYTWKSKKREAVPSHTAALCCNKTTLADYIKRKKFLQGCKSLLKFELDCLGVDSWLLIVLYLAEIQNIYKLKNVFVPDCFGRPFL